MSRNCDNFGVQDIHGNILTSNERKSEVLFIIIFPFFGFWKLGVRCEEIVTILEYRTYMVTFSRQMRGKANCC